MTPKNKKRFSRKNKNSRRPKNNTNNSNTDANRDQMALVARQSSSKRAPNKSCLSLIEQIAKRLNENDGTKLVSIMEGLLTAFQKDLKKRAARLELITILLSILEQRDAEDIGNLKLKLNHPFFPKELKNIMVKPDDLIEQFDIFGLFGFGNFERKAHLLKNGRGIRVEIREAMYSDGDDNVVQEAKLLSQLRHKNIINILAFDKTAPRFAVEFMKLGELSDALEQYEFTSKKLLSILKGVASAMVYITKKGYIVRDLCSHNIVLDADGHCKINNFRYCRYVKDTDGVLVDPDINLDGNFWAPEVKSERRFSTKSDVWDMALLACEVFTVNPERASFSRTAARLSKISHLSLFITDLPFPLPYKCPYPLWQFFRSELVDDDPNKRPSFPKILEEIEKFDDWRLD